MDTLNTLRALDRLAARMRGWGLHPVTRACRNLTEPLVARGLCVEVAGLRIGGTMEHRGYLWALRAGRRESFMSQLFEHAVKPGMTVLDVGAYLGWYSLLAARRVGPHGRVFAFEPDLRNVACLRPNVTRNRFAARISVVPKALADRSATLALLPHPSDPSQTSLDFASSVGALLAAPPCVEATALDEFLAPDVRVDVVKLDVEGAELHALAGMERTLARSGPAVTLFVECNPPALRRAAGSASALLARLHDLGFCCQAVDEARRCLEAVPAEIGALKCVNLFCTRADSR